MASYIVLVAIFQLKDGIINIGTFVFLIDIVRRFLMFARSVCWNFRSIKDIAVMQDGLGLITNDIEIKDKKDAKKLEVAVGRIVFVGVSFRYNGQNENGGKCKG